MRYVELSMRPVEGWMHPFHRAVCERPGVSPALLHRISRLEDGTIMVLYEIEGSPDRVHGVLSGVPKIEEYDLSEGPEHVLVYAVLEPTPVLDGLLDVRQGYRTLIEMPVELDDGGTVRASVLGDEAEMWDSFAAIPDRIEVGIERAGSYYPGTERLFDQLTERQQEILQTAVEIGYYQEPREETHADIAAEVGCSAATVGEHLRKIEGQLLPNLVPDREEPPAGLGPELRQ